MPDLESWRKELCPRGANRNRSGEEHSAAKGEEQGLRGSSSGESQMGLREAARALRTYSHIPMSCRPQCVVEYFHYGGSF